MTLSRRISILLLVVGGTTATGSAQTIVGGSNLLSIADVIQLGNWLGEGPLQLTNIYTKGVGNSTSTAFHAAADGQGRTFTIIGATKDGVTQIIGGYNPFDWRSAPTGWSLATNPADRTAFLFNLTTTVKQSQKLTSPGEHTAYNDPSMGPNFGDSDINVGSNMTSSFAGEASYGSTTTNILGSGPPTEVFTSGQVEVFTMTVVPEPASILALGAGALLMLRRRRAR